MLKMAQGGHHVEIQVLLTLQHLPFRPTVKTETKGKHLSGNASSQKQEQFKNHLLLGICLKKQISLCFMALKVTYGACIMMVLRHLLKY